jgi:hypothetical protein
MHSQRVTRETPSTSIDFHPVSLQIAQGTTGILTYLRSAVAANLLLTFYF